MRKVWQEYVQISSIPVIYGHIDVWVIFFRQKNRVMNIRDEEA